MTTTAEKHEHILSVAETQICAEAYKVSQYENFDAQTAADAQERWADWALLRDAIADGLMDRLKADAKRKALAGLAVAS
jgi:hypothetical protein